MLHELTHGLSSRLHSNGAGLDTNMANGLGEGWSDFVAQSLLADASDDVNGVYTLGGWSTEALAAGFENYYYGIRRFPYAVKTAVGANGRPHNPMTFADIDTTKADLTDGAFPASTVLGSAARDAVHEAGQIWAAMLWEVRARFITRLGFAEGNRRILQLVIDGMKGDPVNPTFLTARDSILAAAIAGGTPADVADIWSGFAARGLGVLAEITRQRQQRLHAGERELPAAGRSPADLHDQRRLDSRRQRRHHGLGVHGLARQPVVGHLLRGLRHGQRHGDLGSPEFRSARQQRR